MGHQPLRSPRLNLGSITQSGKLLATNSVLGTDLGTLKILTKDPRSGTREVWLCDPAVTDEDIDVQRFKGLGQSCLPGANYQWPVRMNPNGQVSE